MRKTSYRAGTPAWVDLSTPDIDATTAFYGALFGWRATETSEDYGGYIRYELDGEAVAGAGPLMADGQPIVWSSYFAWRRSETFPLRPTLRAIHLADCAARGHRLNVARLCPIPLRVHPA